MNGLSQKNCDNDAMVSISSAAKMFGSRMVLKNINLDIERGEGVFICGVNGAGKSTLLRIIAGLLKPDKGSVKLCGFDVDADPEKTKSHLGVISHKSMLYPELTISENLLFFAGLYAVKDSRKRVAELLDDVGLSAYRYDKVSVLSRGMLQRLAIARAIVHRPVILLADEPFTGLDTKACQHLIDVLQKFRADGGTLVMTSHDTRLALRCCGRVVVLDDNSFIFDSMVSKMDTDSFSEDYLSYARGQN